MTKKMPVAERVLNDAFGPCCADCRGPVVMDSVMVKAGKIQRAVYRHVERDPPCLAHRDGPR